MTLFDRLFGSFQNAAEIYRDGEVVSELQHALQAADFAAADGADDDLVLAALLHDVGRFAAPAPHAQIGRRPPGHEILGAELVARHLSPRITWCIRHHVTAKRYLAATQRSYAANLSPASRRDLITQGGPLNEEEVHEFAAEAWALDAIQLRRWCDMAKILGRPTRGLDFWESELCRIFSVEPAQAPSLNW